MTEIFKGKIPKKNKEKLIEKREEKSLSLNSIGFRLELFRVHLGLKAESMAERIAISQGSYSEIQADISKPSCQTIVNIINLTDDPVDLKWLLTGKS